LKFKIGTFVNGGICAFYAFFKGTTVNRSVKFPHTRGYSTVSMFTHRNRKQNR